MEMVLDHLLDRAERPLHLSFDIDAVDPLYAPSTGTRVAGGLNYREAYYICEAVAHSGAYPSLYMSIALSCHLFSSSSSRLRADPCFDHPDRPVYPIYFYTAHTGCLGSMDLVEVNPTLAAAGGDETTADLAVGLISSALGNSII